MRGLAGNPSAAVLSGCAYFVALYGCRVNFTGAELAAVADRRLFPGAEHLHLLLTDPGARHTSRLSLDGAVNDSATGWIVSLFLIQDIAAATYLHWREVPTTIHHGVCEWGMRVVSQVFDKGSM